MFLAGFKICFSHVTSEFLDIATFQWRLEFIVPTIELRFFFNYPHSLVSPKAIFPA